MPSSQKSTRKKLLQTLEGHKGPIHTIIHSKIGGKHILTGGQDRTIKLWSPSNGSLLKSYEGHGYEVLGIAW